MTKQQSLSFDLTIRRDFLEEDIKKLIKQIRPKWNKLQILELEGGFVNAMYKCCDEDEKNDNAILIRIFSFKIDRNDSSLATQPEEPKTDEKVSNKVPTEKVSNKVPTEKVSNEVPKEKVNNQVTEESKENQPISLDPFITINEQNKDQDWKKNLDTVNEFMSNIMKKFSNIFFDRSYEGKVMETLNKSGICQPVYARFQNGLCYGYADGSVLNCDIMRDNDFIDQVTIQLAKMHLIKDLPHPKKDTFATFFDKGKITFEPLSKLLQAKITLLINSPFLKDLRWRTYPKLDYLQDLIDSLENDFSKVGFGDIGFCHNDLNPKNAIWNAKEKKLWFIDFEMTYQNYIAFDIGQHFTFCGGHFLEVYRKEYIPTPEQRIRWIRKYLTERNKLLNKTQTKEEFEKDVWVWYQRCTLGMVHMLCRLCYISPMFLFSPEFMQNPQLVIAVNKNPNIVYEFGTSIYEAVKEHIELAHELANLTQPPNDLIPVIKGEK